MSLYPFNPNAGQTMQTDIPGVAIDRAFVAHYQCTPAALDDDWYVVSVDMKVGAYTLAHSSPGDGCAHNITLVRTATSTADTPGTITIVGTNLAGAAISEVLTPGASGATVSGTKAFATVTSITGAGWEAADGADKIKVGFGDVVGLPDKLSHNTVIAACLNNARESTAPTVAASASALESNTFDLSSALNGTVVDLYYLV